MLSEAELGARVRELRRQRRLSAQELAERSEMTVDAWWGIERGDRGIKSAEIMRMADALGVHPMALLDPESLLARLPVAARAVNGISSSSSVLDRLTALAELSDSLRRAGLPSDPRLPDMSEVPPSGWLPRARRVSSFVLSKLRSYEGATSDPLERLVAFIEDEYRIDVLIEDHPDDPLLGAAITDSSLPLIFLNASQQRQRLLFTLAHELAHVLMGDGEAITLDQDLRAHSDEERVANAFAAELLMPEREVVQRCEQGDLTPQLLCSMLVEFGVSLQSLIYRLHNLRIIGASGRDRLQSIGFAGIISRVADDDARAHLAMTRATSVPTKPPLLLASRAIKGYARGVISVRPVAGLFHVPAEEVIASVEAAERTLGDHLDAPSSLEAGISDEDLYEGVPA